MAANTERPAAGMSPGASPHVHPRHHVGNPAHSVAEAGDDLLLALAAVGDECTDVGLRIVDARPVGRPVAGVVAIKQPREAPQVVAHVAVRRGDDTGRPPHDVVAGEEDPVFAQGEADVVRGVARGVHALEGPAVPFYDVAVAHLDLGDELHVAALLDLHPAAAGSVRAIAVDCARPDHRLERPGGGRMVVVGMGDENVTHLLAVHCRSERFHMSRDVGPRIDDRDPAPADDVGAGAVQGEGARIARHDPPHGNRARWRDEVDPAVLELELAPERYFDGHFPSLLSVMARSPSTSRRAPTAIVSRSTAA